MTGQAPNHAEWEREILEQLDRHAKEYEFPMLDNAYLHHAVARLTAFRGETEWLIAFQVVALGQHQFLNTVSAYGNEVSSPGVQRAAEVITAPPGEPIWDDDRNFLLDKHDFAVMIKGERKHFSPSPEDYERAGIDPDSGMPPAAQVLRLLTFLLPEAFYLDDETLLEMCGRRGTGLSKFLQLDDWQHPNIADDEMPSQTPCMQSLARALATGDSDAYRCPEDGINTHWSNWLVD